jgi:signal transduction histidine kinase
MSAISRATPEVDETAETARLCHDLRQYVAAGLMLVGEAEESGSDADTAWRMSTIARVFEEISGLLDEHADGERRATTVDLAVVVAECVEITRLMSKVDIEIGPDSRPAFATARPALLRRAVLNVLNNATRAAGAGGRVTVTVQRTAEHAWIEVGDDGAGFGRIPGINGYGMSVVEAAVRAVDGRLEIRSGPGPGTRVRLRLPRARTANGLGRSGGPS